MIRIVQNFTGYPDGVKRAFTAGEEVDGMDAYADEAGLFAKGLAEPVKAKKDKLAGAGE